MKSLLCTTLMLVFALSAFAQYEDCDHRLHFTPDPTTTPKPEQRFTVCFESLVKSRHFGRPDNWKSIKCLVKVDGTDVRYTDNNQDVLCASVTAGKHLVEFVYHNRTDSILVNVVSDTTLMSKYEFTTVIVVISPFHRYDVQNANVCVNTNHVSGEMETYKSVRLVSNSPMDTVELKVRCVGYEPITRKVTVGDKNQTWKLDKVFTTMTVVNSLNAYIETPYGSGDSDTLKLSVPTYTKFNVQANKKGYEPYHADFYLYSSRTETIDLEPETHRVTFTASRLGLDREYLCSVNDEWVWTGGDEFLNLATGTYSLECEGKKLDLYICESGNVHIFFWTPKINWKKAAFWTAAGAATGAAVYCGARHHPQMTDEDLNDAALFCMPITALGAALGAKWFFKNHKVGFQTPIKISKKKSN